MPPLDFLISMGWGGALGISIFRKDILQGIPVSSQGRKPVLQGRKALSSLLLMRYTFSLTPGSPQSYDIIIPWRGRIYS